jgi:hypothetical protein
MLCVVRFLPSDIEDLNQRVQNFASQVNISNLNIRVENARDVPSDAQDLVSFISKHCFSNMSDSEREQLDEIRSRLPNITEKSIQYCTNLVCSQSARRFRFRNDLPRLWKRFFDKLNENCPAPARLLATIRRSPLLLGVVRTPSFPFRRRSLLQQHFSRSQQSLGRPARPLNASHAATLLRF